MKSVTVEMRPMLVPVDFNVDSVNRDIEVVRADRGLSVHFESRIPQECHDLFLIGADTLGEAAVFFPGGPGHALFRRNLWTDDGEARSAYGLDVVTLTGHPEISSFTPASDVNAGFLEYATDGRLGAVVPIRQVALSGTIPVVPNEGISIDVIPSELCYPDFLCGACLSDGIWAFEVAPCGFCRAEQYATAPKASSDRLGTSPDTFRDLARGLTGAVTPDEVVNVEVNQFEGHVYDLSTAGGWYLADGIVIHNSRDDDRVRPAHVEAHGQEIPANLRFRLRKQRYIRGGRGVGGFYVLSEDEYVMAREPRDDSLPDDQKERCRCRAITIPGVIARRVVTMPAVVSGARVTGRVEVRFPRIVESEHGTSEDRPAHFMGGAVNTVASRLRSAAARRT